MLTRYTLDQLICVQIWSPYFGHDINLVEEVQHTFTFHVIICCNLQYRNCNNCNVYFGLESLQLRHLHTNLCFCFQIVNGFVLSLLMPVRFLPLLLKEMLVAIAKSYYPSIRVLMCIILHILIIL